MPLRREPDVPEDQHFITSALSPGPAQRRLAVAIVLGIPLVFVSIIAGPLRGVRPGRIDIFIPAYGTAIVVCDLITSILLYGQFSIVRSRATLVIASGYLFAALGMIPWLLAFPGLSGPAGLIGGMQTTPYLGFFRHVGFTLFVVAYALSRDRDPPRQFRQGGLRAQIALSIGL